MNEAEPLIKLERENSSHKKAIVFIHGIGTRDPREYWKQFTEVLLHDTHSLVSNFDVFVWGYPTHKGPSWLINLFHFLKNHTFIDASPAIERLGGLWRATYRTRFREYEDVVLVCHSMGGLVIQSWIVDILEEGEGANLDRLRHITFYATPHSGAPIAKAAWNDQLESMTVTSNFITSTRRRWHNHVVQWKYSPIKLEDRIHDRYIPHFVLVGIEDKVVPRNFAEIMGIPCEEVPGNHTTLIQPTNIDDTRYKIWRNELERTLNSRNPLTLEPSLETAIFPNPIQIPSMQHSIYSEGKRKKKLVSPDPKKVFVVYGRNNVAQKEMFAFLRAIGLSPMDHDQAVEITGMGAPFINDVLEAAFSIAQAIIVLMTGDDEAKLKSEYFTSELPDYEKNLTPQARPNVFFEAGIALAIQPNRTILVEWEMLRPSFTDISGRHITRLSNRLENRWSFVQKLQLAGCQVDLTSNTWRIVGNFTDPALEN